MFVHLESYYAQPRDLAFNNFLHKRNTQHKKNRPKAALIFQSKSGN